jgi:hypothetical protein
LGPIAGLAGAVSRQQPCGEFGCDLLGAELDAHLDARLDALVERLLLGALLLGGLLLLQLVVGRHDGVAVEPDGLRHAAQY